MREKKMRRRDEEVKRHIERTFDLLEKMGEERVG